MSKKILLTSFQTWRSHQHSNSSDDLLLHIQKQTVSSVSLTFLRQLPVDISRASQKAITTIQSLQPDIIICCGMAESRQQLTLESQATWDNDKIHTSVDLEQLVAQLSFSAISHNAGKFVCEGVYYQVLRHLQQFSPQSQCLFAHIPLLTGTNLPQIRRDFQLIIENIVSLGVECR